ncbi:MAG: hypothetical protein V1494_03735 [Candidatus Diapherotrites archaeon]
MTMVINSLFHPYRMTLREKKPVSLEIEVKNKHNVPKLVGIELILGNGLSLDQSGFNTVLNERVGEMKPDDVKKFFYSVYAKPITGPGEYAVTFKVKEYYTNYHYVEKYYTKKMDLTVQ